MVMATAPKHNSVRGTTAVLWEQYILKKGGRERNRNTRQRDPIIRANHGKAEDEVDGWWSEIWRWWCRCGLTRRNNGVGFWTEEMSYTASGIFKPWTALI
ncbi:hypothetical protein ACJZ2D_011281 [Fusarium nematophilum]